MRIQKERTDVAKWSKTAQTTADEIMEALEEALALLEDPGKAYRLANATTRRMFNQALWTRLEVQHEGLAVAQSSPWLDALEAVAGRRIEEERLRRQPATRKSLGAALARHEARKHLSRPSDGSGLNENQMVRLRGFEPPRARAHTDLNRACIPVSPQPLAGLQLSN